MRRRVRAGMRELLRAVFNKKPIFALMEPEAKHGGLTLERVHQRLEAAEAKYASWGLAAEMAQWGFAQPSVEQLYGVLFQQQSVIWERIGLFQDVTMRLIASRVLAEDNTYVQGELRHAQRV